MENRSAQVRDLRTDYTSRSLSESEVDANPFVQLDQWLAEAIEAKALEPNAMVVSTLGDDGFPASRVVLLRGLSAEGLNFYTNYDSQKGTEIAAHPKVSACFFWPELERQIRISGTCHKLSDEESDAYFASRPAGSQLGAWASPQSQTLPSREALETILEEVKAKYEGQDAIPRPPHWGGYRIVPHRIEFWQGRASRLHDRIVFHKQGEDWQSSRLAP
ncbi:MAG: pyridoxamine 5'-phosphate oxidase [Salibacteraceae bacterium]